MIPHRITDIAVDYANEILVINGKKITTPVKVVVKEPDGWDIAKLFNCEKGKQDMFFPELIIDANGILNDLRKQELKELVRNVIKEESFPAE